jgi:hypothetical protein
VTPSSRSTAATSFRLRRVGFKSRPQVRCSIPAFRHPRHRCSVRPRGPNRVPGQAGWAHPRSGAFGFNGFEYDTFVRLGLPIVGVMGQRRGVGEHQNLPQDDVSGTGRRRRSRAPSISRCRLRAGWLRRARDRSRRTGPRFEASACVWVTQPRQRPHRGAE